MAQVRTASEMDASSGAAMYAGSNTIGFYTEQSKNIIQGLNEEVDSSARTDLQTMCLQLQLDRETTVRLLDTKTFNQIVAVLLQHCNNDIHQVIIDLAEFVPTIIQDLRPELRDKLLWLSQTAIKQRMNTERTIYGREESLSKLLSLINSDPDTKLINVCGMPGIGKSLLVKHLRCRLGNVFYVDARDVRSLEDLKSQILRQSDIPADVSTSMGDFLDFLLQNKNDEFVLIIDDLSTLMDSSNKSCRPSSVLHFIHDLLLKMKLEKIQLKLVVTSQTHLTMTSEAAEPPLLRDIKVKMKDYTKDLPLTKLSDEDAVKFLGPSLQELEPYEKKRLVRLCDGNPLALHLMGELALKDFSPTTEISHISPADVQHGITSQVFDKFERAFIQLPEQNRLMLYAVVMFDLGAPLSALHYMLGSGESYSEFSAQLKTAFSNSFWLRIQTMARERYTLVITHHPLIKKFLCLRMDISTEEQSLKLMLKRRYISYYINQLIHIGKRCVPDQPKKPDFVQKTCTEFLRDQLNFKRTFVYLADFNDPCIPFSKDGDGGEVRNPSEVAHLFLSLCQFHDWFNGTLLYALEELMHQPSIHIHHQILIQTLYGLILAISQNWTELGNFLAPHMNLVDPKHIITLSRDLFSLCKALRGYAAGAFYAHESKVKEVGIDKLVEKREDVLDDSLKKLNLKHLSADWRRVRVYFSIHVLLVKAKAATARNPDNVSTLQSAYDICRRAKDTYVPYALILEPLVYSALADYKSSEGHLHRTNSAAASELYRHAANYFKTVTELLKARMMDKGVAAARNLDKYAVLMRSWGFVLVKGAVGERLEEATNMFTIAKEIGAKSITIWEHKSFCSSSMEDVFTAYMNQASVFTNLAKYHHKRPTGFTVNRLKYGFQSNALKYYGLAYSLLKEDYRKCHLIAKDWRIDKLALQLPFFMEVTNHCKESIDKVISNLQEIQNEVQRGAHQRLSLSGSEVYASTSDDYDDSFSSDDMDCEETIVSPQSTFSSTPSTSHISQPEAALRSKKRKL